MGKLYPPQIEGILPSFYFKDGYSSADIIIPFKMNPAVAVKDVKGFAIQIKTVMSNTIIGDVIKNTVWQYEINGYEVVFNLTDKSLFKIGQYYKLQLAYIDMDNEIGHYSQVGIIKCTDKPSIQIRNLEPDKTNIHTYTYYGEFKPPLRDTLEKMYSSHFNVFGPDGELMYSTEEKIHNINNDVNDVSLVEFNLIQDLEPLEIYQIQFVATTITGRVESTIKYKLRQAISVEPDLKADVIATLDYDNGYIQVSLKGPKNKDNIEVPQRGSFILYRASDDSNYMIWHEVHKFNLQSEPATRDVWKDFSIEQGKTYLYGISQVNSYLKSEKILSNYITADFEDMFLYDGKRQLKIQFNPKVNSLKNTLLEQKVDTMGSKYPFVFRNGNILYKEFPISGLISYLSDEQSLFMSKEQLGIVERENETERKFSFDFKGYTKLIEEEDDYTLRELYKALHVQQQDALNYRSQNFATTDLTTYNINAERKFKLEVLDWLSNGELKLFKSPSEGNYIVRLMNVSLSPETRVGRMLHTFTANAYEMMEYSLPNLQEVELVEPLGKFEDKVKWETLELTPDKFYYSEQKHCYVLLPSYTTLLDRYLNSIEFIDMVPGDRVNITLGKYPNQTVESVEFGITGGYRIDLSSQQIITRVELENISRPQGQINYSYTTTSTNSFETIQNVFIEDVPLQQFVGPFDVYNYISNIKYKVDKVNFIRFITLPTQVYNAASAFDEFYIYYNEYRKQYYQPLQNTFENKTAFWYPEDDVYQIKINGEILNLTESQEYTIDFDDLVLNELEIGPGVKVEISYVAKEIQYEVENNNAAIKKAYADWRNKQQDIVNKIANSGNNIGYRALKSDFVEEYRLRNIYLNQLKVTIDQIVEENNVIK